MSDTKVSSFNLVRASRDVTDLVDKLGAPPVSKEDYRDYLLQVIAELTIRLEAVEEEMKNDD